MIRAASGRAATLPKLCDMSESAVEVAELVHHYGSRRALAGVSFAIARREIFAFLGPNGGGKTTLFRILTTLLPPQAGRVVVLGHKLPAEMDAARRRFGVVFQSPSLDRKLTVWENVLHQGYLYGLSGADLRKRADEALARLGAERWKHDLVQTLSGGSQRRVELAKALLHDPELLLLDEPSTGLDPGVRTNLWAYLRQLRDENNVTVILTTHLLEEADKADRIAILDEGRLVALDTPDRLRAELGGDSLTLTSAEPELLRQQIEEQFQVSPILVGQTVRLVHAEAHRLVPRIVEAFPTQIQSLTLAKPSLEDVFIARTGHRFWSEESRPQEVQRGKH